MHTHTRRAGCDVPKGTEWQRGCGRGEPGPGSDGGRGEPGPGADVGGMSPVPAQIWAGHGRTSSRQVRVGSFGVFHAWLTIDELETVPPAYICICTGTERFPAHICTGTRAYRIGLAFPRTR